ncbi:AAA family ATPase [Treponema sp.]|uniref:AAA family ATPase n=1 Tax=Treponema sp. TaxID=166 RepID=UPI0025E7AF39|nr:AAA family ATPase [Treponema sp.]MBR4321052.1 NgoFVII family restriction endonuclease [Treponema sp.]
MEVVKVFLFDKDNEVQYGLNWGQRDGREPNQAYLQLTPEVYRSDFFPVKKHYFLVDTDDGFSFVMNRGQKGEDGSALETPEDNSLLGKYLRKRLGVPENSRIEKTAIEAYGRSDIDFVKIGMNHYKMDFSLNHSFVSSEVINQSRNRIIFGAPGTGKSKKLSADFEKYFLTCLNSSDLHKQLYDGIHSQPIDADQAEWITALGIRYATYITEKYINPKKQNELIDDFDLLNNEEQTTKKKEQLVQSAKAAYRLHLNDKLLCCKTRGERVTFHPNYSYAQFVGTYKPVQDSADENQIKYEYIPGPFMRIYTAAKQNPSQNFLLLIEEINRANVAAVFGDVFQLLDRDENGNSEYPVAASEDIKKYLAKNGIHEDELKIPSNMYIWATMNSADQGVFPMDTAFKRRWEFEYIGIDDGEKKEDGTDDETFASYALPIPSKYDNKKKLVLEYQSIKWNIIRHAINDKLKEISGVNEDKLLGPYFLSKTLLEKSTKVSAENNNEEKAKICSSFKSKVLMYLYEDVVKMNPTELFNKEIFPEGKSLHYSDLCLKFDEVGLEIFGKDFIKES